MFWGNKDIIAVGGGKGGIGKSCFVANLGYALSRMGKQVVLIDTDIGAANLHTLIGVPYPDKTLADFLRSPQTDLNDALLDTPYQGLRLLSSASDVLAISSPNYKARKKLFRGIQKLAADVIIFDLAAGSHQRATDFFSLAPMGVIIVEPIPTSLENAFSFLKNLLFRQLLRIFYQDQEKRKFIQEALDPAGGNANLIQFSKLVEDLNAVAPDKIAVFRNQYQNASKMLLVANAVKTPSQKQVADKFTKIVKRYLTINMQILGCLPYEPLMNDAITARMPFAAKFPSSAYAASIQEMTARLPLKKHEAGR
jgi:flagellar biosynthesis protein FlhG